MPEVTAHAPGTSSWAELNSPDVAASKEFYRAVFGWDSYTLTTSEYGDYEIFTLGGVQGPEVAGAYELTDDAQPPSWTCYFRSDDLAASLEAVGRLGGSVLAEPIDIADLGRLALCADSQGADFALWLPYNLKGAGVVDEPSAMCWVELATPDVSEAHRFYGGLFGWTPVPRSYHSPGYTVWTLDDLPVAGGVALERWWPPDHPSHWFPYFWAPDCDATTDRAAGLGARVLVPPTDIETGRFSIMRDPVGARLAVVTPAPGMPPGRPRA